MSFRIVLTNVVLMLFYLACGWALVKARKGVPDHAKTFSAVLVYVCAPAMILSSFQSMEYSMVIFGKAMAFLAVSMLTQTLFFLILFLLLRRRYQDARNRVLTVGAILGNAGFFGLPIITALFPGESVVACYSTLYITGMNILVFTVGVWLLTRDKRYISLRAAVLNPTVLSASVGILLYLLRVKFPVPVESTLSLLGKTSTPLCMLVLGFRLASMEFREVFAQPFSYFVCALKLIVFPLFAYALVRFLPWFDPTFKTSLLVLSAAPSAAVILSLAELHGCEQKLCANVVLMTTLFSVVTIPALMLILGL